MTGSDRFKPIQKIAEKKERDAAEAFGKTLQEREAAQRQAADVQMAVMCRVEGAAQQPDGEAGRGRHGQGRVCPVPRTMYL